MKEAKLKTKPAQLLKVDTKLENRLREIIVKGREDWPFFATTVFGITLDPEQEAVLRSCQVNKMTSVASGTARGKDFIAAVAAMCFLYLTPRFNKQTGELTKNTKVALTAPTDRQVGNIMFPEISRLYSKMVNRGYGRMFGGRLTGYDVRTEYEEWFLTGFKADEHNTEAWSGFHAVNTMFVVTEASGIPELVFNAIEGNLQGNSRILIVFNPNTFTGYAAASQKSDRWHRFRLDSLQAPNVLQKKMIIPGQVDYDWVADKVQTWCTVIQESDYMPTEGDFIWENNVGEKRFYRPNDLFRVKVRGMFPKVSVDALIPIEWIEAAQERWLEQEREKWPITAMLRIGQDVAGMGRDMSSKCFRRGDYVEKFVNYQSMGVADTMKVTGALVADIRSYTDTFLGKTVTGFIDTIGEGAGVFSRIEELNSAENAKLRVFSSKFSEAAKTAQGNPLKDRTNQYEFLNMRAYCYWGLRDWLNPAFGSKAMLPPGTSLTQGLTEIKWWFQSNGKIQIEAKEDIKVRLGRSLDEEDALALTFWPEPDVNPVEKKKINPGKIFF